MRMILGLIDRKHPSFETLWNEVWNLFKFGVVGVTSLALNTGIYALFSRVLWPDGQKTVMSVAAVLLASIYNFSLHRMWTFKARAFDTSMLLRYGCVVLIGTGLQGTFFFLGHEVLHIYDFAVLIGSAFIIAGATYFLHRWFTFHPKHSA